MQVAPCLKVSMSYTLYSREDTFLVVRKVRVCPRCGGAKIRATASSVGGWLVPTTYYCESEGCNYSGPIYVEVDSDQLEDFQRAITRGSESETVC